MEILNNDILKAIDEKFSQSNLMDVYFEVAKSQSELTKTEVLKRISDYLYGLCKHTTNPLQQRKLCKQCVCELAELIFEGKLPSFIKIES